MVDGVKDKLMKFFKTNITQDYSKQTFVNHMYEGGKKPRKPTITKITYLRT